MSLGPDFTCLPSGSGSVTSAGSHSQGGKYHLIHFLRPSSVGSILCRLTHLTLVTNIIPTLQMRKPKHREVK